MESERHSSSCKTNNQTPAEPVPPQPLEVSSPPGNGNGNSARPKTKRKKQQFVWQIVGVGICGILAEVVFFFTYWLQFYETTNGIIIGVIGIGVIFVVAILVFLYLTLRMRKKQTQQVEVGDLENNNSHGRQPPLILEPSSHFVGVVGTCGILVEGIFIWTFLTRFQHDKPLGSLILGLVLTGVIFPVAIFVLFFLRYWRMRKKQCELENNSHAQPQ